MAPEKKTWIDNQKKQSNPLVGRWICRSKKYGNVIHKYRFRRGGKMIQDTTVGRRVHHLSGSWKASGNTLNKTIQKGLGSGMSWSYRYRISGNNMWLTDKETSYTCNRINRID